MKTYVFSRDEVLDLLVKESLHRHDPSSKQSLHKVTSNRDVLVSKGELKTITIELLEVDGDSI